MGGPPHPRSEAGSESTALDAKERCPAAPEEAQRAQLGTAEQAGLGTAEQARLDPEAQRILQAEVLPEQAVVGCPDNSASRNKRPAARGNSSPVWADHRSLAEHIPGGNLEAHRVAGPDMSAAGFAAEPPEDCRRTVDY